MCVVLRSLPVVLLDTVRTRVSLRLEILYLRHQLGVLQRTNRRRIRLKATDRLGRSVSPVARVAQGSGARQGRHGDRVAPEGFRLYWRWKSRSRSGGRPATSEGVRKLIREMSCRNVLRGAPKLHRELLKLGIDVSQATVAKHMMKHRKPPSQTWRTFLENHVKQLVSVDFFVVPAVTFRILYVFVVLVHERRRIVHFNVTEHPTAEWTAAQLMQALAWETAPRYLLRDRDQIYGDAFRSRAASMAMTEVLTALRSPWQSPYVERLIGSIRRECLDHVVVINAASLRRQIASCVSYHRSSRCHLSLEKDSPDGRAVGPPKLGRVVAVPMVGGLHHRYERRTA